LARRRRSRGTESAGPDTERDGVDTARAPEDLLDETVQAVRDAVDFPPPTVGLVLGSGLGAFAEKLRGGAKLPFETLPHMSAPRTAGHEGNVCLGFVDDAPVVCLQGRLHLYEGHPAWKVVHGVRLMAKLGAKAVLVTNAAAALDPTWTQGALMIIADHLNFMHHEALAGPDAKFPPSCDVRSPYDPVLRQEFHDVARSENLLAARIGKKADLVLLEGVYAAVRDGSYGTPAHARLLRSSGAQAFGMSTVPEVTALRLMGVRVAGLSYLSHVVDPESGPIEDETTSRWGLSHFERVVRGWLVHAHRLG
jgi:purine-nucleoside phosphorylase